MEVQPKEVRRYSTNEGKVPFDEWIDSLRDTKAKSRIDLRLERIKLGNLGDFRSVGEGVCELRIDCGPGYRVDFGQIGNIIVILLLGGDKSTQNRDIAILFEMCPKARSVARNEAISLFDPPPAPLKKGGASGINVLFVWGIGNWEWK